MRAWLIACLLAGMLLPSLGSAELLQLTEEAPPTSFSRDGKLDGYSVEVVRMLVRRTGHAAHMELLPWTRAYHLAKTEPVLPCSPWFVPRNESHCSSGWGRFCRAPLGSIR